jgi:hypothetical protein
MLLAQGWAVARLVERMGWCAAREPVGVESVESVALEKTPASSKHAAPWVPLGAEVANCSKTAILSGCPGLCGKRSCSWQWAVTWAAELLARWNGWVKARKSILVLLRST